MKILMLPTYVFIARAFVVMIFALFASGKLASILKKKYGEDGIFKKIVSPESILVLAAYLILFYVFSFVWPTGWEVFNSTSGVFWPVQGLIALAVIGWFCLQKMRFLPWFFLIMAAVMTTVGFMRDPRIYSPRAEAKKSVPNPDSIRRTDSAQAAQNADLAALNAKPKPALPEPIKPEAKADSAGPRRHSTPDTLLVYVPAKSGGRSKPVFLEWSEENELLEQSDRYYVRLRQGFNYRAKPEGCVRCYRPDDSYYDFCPGEYRDERNNTRLNGKRTYESLSAGETYVVYTIEPQK